MRGLTIQCGLRKVGLPLDTQILKSKLFYFYRLGVGIFLSKDMEGLVDFTSTSFSVQKEGVGRCTRREEGGIRSSRNLFQFVPLT